MTHARFGFATEIITELLSRRTACGVPNEGRIFIITRFYALTRRNIAQSNTIATLQVTSNLVFVLIHDKNTRLRLSITFVIPILI